MRPAALRPRTTFGENAAESIPSDSGRVALRSGPVPSAPPPRILVPPTSGTEASLAAQMRVLALDYGSARCGCALSDATGTLATPIDPVPRPATKAGLRALRELVDERDVERVVVGLPLSLSGGDSDQTREARAFADRLRSALGARVPVDLYDERFTTTIAARGPEGARSSEDSRAAAVLLDDWLARHGHEHEGAA